MSTRETMDRPAARLSFAAGLLAAGVLVASAAPAQERPERPPVGPPPGSPQEGKEDPMKEVVELFQEVSKHLDAIDRLLLEASAQRATEESAAALRKIEELLKKAEKTEGQAIEKIERIIVLVPRQSGGGGGGMAPPKPGEPQEGEGQPQDPGERKSPDRREERPQELGDQPGNQKGEQNRAELPGESKDPGRNIEGPDKPEKERMGADSARGGWEVQLPRRQTEVFRNRLRDTQIPPRYHRWIERWRSIRDRDRQ